jgi:hypothetical protein
MLTGPDVVLTELDLGHVIVRCTHPRVGELSEMLLAGGDTAGDEIIEVRWGNAPSGQPALSDDRR